jgi:sugar lactone lactonase YvrE
MPDPRFTRSPKISSFPASSHRPQGLRGVIRRWPVIAAALLFCALSALWLWPGAAAADSSSLLPRLLSRISSGAPAAFGFSPLPMQGGSSSVLTISTLAGGGLSSNVPARQAPVVFPTAVTRDPLGRGFYLIDETNSGALLRFVNTSPNPVTLAGTTVQPNQINLIAGGGVILTDGQAARDADLGLVTGLAVDPSGNAVYLCTPLLGAIRVINVGTQNFTIFNRTTAPGTIGSAVSLSLTDFRALTLHPVTREFFFIGTSGANRVVYRLDNFGNPVIHAGGGNPQVGNGDGGGATQARLITPLGLAFDGSNNLLIADGGDTRNNLGSVRKVDVGGTITTLAGELAYPTGITMGPGGHAYVVLGNAQQIIRVTSAGAVTRIAGNTSGSACNVPSDPSCGDGGLAVNASFSFPGSTDGRSVVLTADSSGLVFPDFLSRRVRYVNLGAGTANFAGTTIDPQRVNSVIGNGLPAPYDDTAATAAELFAPVGVVADPDGNLYISDTSNHRLRFVNRTLSPVTLFANTGWAITVQPGEIVTLNREAGQERIDDRVTTSNLSSPQGLVMTAHGVYIVDSQNGVKWPSPLSGKRSGVVRFLNTSANEVTVLGVNVPSGMIRIVAGIPQGTPTSQVPSSINDGAPATQAIIFPTDVAVDGAGHLYIADQGNNRIRRVNAGSGIISTFYGDGGAATLNGATGITFDAAGRLHIADTKNNRVLRQDTAGGAAFSIIANASQGVSHPRDLTVEGSGKVFVTNALAHRILQIVAPGNELGTVTVAAGTGAAGLSGDGGLATSARLNLPNPGTATNDIQLTTNITMLPDGSVAFTDTVNNRVRQLRNLPNQAPVLAAVSNQTVNEGATLQVSFSASDINGDPISFSLTGTPTFGTFTDQGNGTASLQLTPGFSHAGSYNLSVTASDGALSASQNFTVTVNDVNRAPVVTANPIPTPIQAPSPSGASVNLQGSATDPDGDTVSYQWFDGASQIANTASATVTLGIGTHSIFLLATDSKGASASTAAQSVTVTAPPGTNQAPVAVANALPATIEATSPAGATVNLNGSGSSDADGDPLSFSWRDNGTQIATTMTASVTLAIGTHSITLTVSDGRGGVSTTPAQAVEVKASDDYTIFTIAGNGSYGFCGDNGPGNAACFKEVTAVNTDSAGRLLIVDALNRNVRRVSAQGIITALAGNTSLGNGGDGKTAAFASFGAPSGVAADAAGNVYVSDVTYNRIRIVTPDGKINHFAGDANGMPGYTGDGGLAANARLRRPTRLAVDGQGNLYIADSGNQRIRKVDAVTKIITTIAGNGVAAYTGDNVQATFTGLNNPAGLAFDAQGNLYIADSGNHRIRKVDAVTKIITTIAGNGGAGYGGENLIATQTSLNTPMGVSLDGSGNVYIADRDNHRARLLEVATGRLTTITGQGVFGFGGDDGKAKLAAVGTPEDLAVAKPDGRALFLADTGNRRARKLDKDVVPNNPPVAVAKPLPAEINFGDAIQLDGTDSSDPDGDPLSYSWTNNGAQISTAAVATIVLNPGTHSIVLTVRDGRGGEHSTAPQVVTVLSSGVTIDSVFPNSGRRGENIQITILGSGFLPQSKVSLSGIGVTVFTKYVSSTKLTATLMISSSAFTGIRDVIVTNPDGGSATKVNAFTIRQ